MVVARSDRYQRSTRLDLERPQHAVGREDVPSRSREVPEVCPTSRVEQIGPGPGQCSARKVARGGLNAEGGIVGGEKMRIGFSSSCAIGLAIALTLGAVSTADAQQRDTTRRAARRTTKSTQRIPISKERGTTTSPGEVAQPAPPPPAVNQDSIAAA